MLSSCQFGNFTVKSKTQIFNLVKTAGKIMGTSPTLYPQELFEQTTIRQVKNIISDNTHALFSEFELLNSGKSVQVY